MSKQTSLRLQIVEYNLSASQTAAGKLFHTTGPATEKALAKFRSCPWNSVVAA